MKQATDKKPPTAIFPSCYILLILSAVLISAAPKPSGSIATRKPITASSVQKDKPQFASAMMVDDNPATRWAAKQNAHKVWIDIDLQTATRFNRVLIDECIEFGPRIRKFDLQYKDTAGAWRSILTGAVIGRRYTRAFAPVTARYVRLNILEAMAGPTIRELQLFTPGK